MVTLWLLVITGIIPTGKISPAFVKKMTRNRQVLILSWSIVICRHRRHRSDVVFRQPLLKPDVGPGLSSSRPSTAPHESVGSQLRSLLPLAAVVSSSLPPSQWGIVPQRSVFSLPSGPGIVPTCPPTATCPGTAPALYHPLPPIIRQLQPWLWSGT